MREFVLKCRDAAFKLKRSGKITVFGHRDADGICASAIVKLGLKEKDVTIKIVRQSTAISELVDDCRDSFPVFVDLGASDIDEIGKHFDDFLVFDHHPPATFHSNVVNPWDYGIDGTREISGAGVAYLVAKEVLKENVALSSLAIAGAIGDKQDIGGFKGKNMEIFNDAKKSGTIVVTKTGRIWIANLPLKKEMFCANEFSDLVNACARVNKPYIAVDMCLGNVDAYKGALDIWNIYKEKHENQLSFILDRKKSIIDGNRQNLAYFIYFDKIEPGFVGVLAEDILSHFPEKPVIVMSKAKYGIKASGRATPPHLSSGIHLGEAMNRAMEYADGNGGGHDVAAGATFSPDCFDDFVGGVNLAIFDQLLSRLKLVFEIELKNEKEARSVERSIAVDNEKYRTTMSLATIMKNKVYVFVVSEDVGTFKNTVDDLIVCLSSCNEIVKIGNKKL
ncbi:MAG: KEOPS complex subunit Pcc1 [Candidatus Methanofastidiosia archaeon]